MITFHVNSFGSYPSNFILSNKTSACSISPTLQNPQIIDVHDTTSLSGIPSNTLQAFKMLPHLQYISIKALPIETSFFKPISQIIP
ncbi:pentatricopeptide repeat-containing protein [Trifolium repens]|nr:pentatricopeptide repeat-containing protein [Trifolium repens]